MKIFQEKSVSSLYSKGRFFLLVMIFLASSMAAYADRQSSLEGQAAAEDKQTSLESGDSSPLPSPDEEMSLGRQGRGLAVPLEKKVTAIEVKGNHFISTRVILSKIKTRAQADYSTNIISDDIKRLNELGYFSDIKIDTEDFEGGLKVIIILTEKSLLEKIILKGRFSRVFREENLKEAIKLKEGQYLDQVQLKEDINALKDLCIKKGYAQAEISSQSEMNPATNKIILTLSIEPGKRIRIKRIDIRGNKNFKTKRLLKLIKSKRAGIFSSGFFKEDLLKDDVERLKSFYRKEGFIDVKIDYEAGSLAKRGLMFFIIRIDEGRKYVVGEVFIKGNAVFTASQIKKDLKLIVPGKVFSQESMQEDASAIQSIYFNRGYIFTRVDGTTYLNPESKKVDVTYTVDEGILGYVDKIKIRGNIKTRDKVIRL